MSPAPLTQHPSKSTGPRTEEGKRKSALNATRHGLTGRTVVMPYEDMEAYHTFCEELFEDLAPETPLEKQYAQTFCDTQWRLNRARSIEDSMYALGHFEAAGQIETEHPQVHAALTAGRVFRDDSKSFANLSLYEQRLAAHPRQIAETASNAPGRASCGCSTGKRRCKGRSAAQSKQNTGQALRCGPGISHRTVRFFEYRIRTRSRPRTRTRHAERRLKTRIRSGISRRSNPSRASRIRNI